MDDTNEDSVDHEFTGIDEQFHSQDPTMADVNNAESSDPSLTEMLAVISKSGELAQNLQDLMLSSPCASENSPNSLNSTESKSKQELTEFDSTAPSLDTRTTTSTTTTNLTLYDKNYRAYKVKVLHQESVKPEVEIENGENVIVGDFAKVDIGCGHNDGTVNHTASSRSTRFPPNENVSLVQADGDKSRTGSSKKKKKKFSPSAKNSGKKSAIKTNTEPGKLKSKWRFSLNLADFSDTESLQHSIDQWLENVISSLLSEAQDLDDFESLIKLLGEARNLRLNTVLNCILKLSEAIQFMSSLVEGNKREKYDVLFTEAQFVLAEFYTKEGKYLSALDCLRTLEETLPGDTQKSRLCAKIAKIMEHCLEYSVDFPTDQKEHEGDSNTSVLNQKPEEVVLSYYDKALNFIHKEPSVEKREIIQRCCYLGKAAVFMRLWNGKFETERNLLEVRENLLSTERLFNNISPAMRCQFYLAEAFLRHFEGGHQMMVDIKIQRAKIIAEEEAFLETKCLGSKRLHFLSAEFNNTANISEVGEEILDLNSVEDQF